MLSLNREAVLLDYRIGEHFARDALDLRLCFLTADAAVERDLEELALAEVVKAALAHLFQSAVNGFALRVEHTLLERNVNVGFHGSSIIPSAQRTS